ncbi:MAG: class I SAM-dependent methyltransferase [Candidatus Lokiarchaeota archaeon]
MDNLKSYYKERKNEYEEIYNRQDPERLKEQLIIKDKLVELLYQKNLLEIGCGTGYWTKFISKTALKITATDYNQDVLDIAKSKDYYCDVEFEVENAYNLGFENSLFNAGVSNFLISHVPKSKLFLFLSEFHRVLTENSIVFIADNVNNEKYGGTLIQNKDDKNTYKLRKLKNGTEFKIIKNYYTMNQIYKIFKQFDNNLTESNIFYGTNFWFIYYILQNKKCS